MRTSATPGRRCPQSAIGARWLGIGPRIAVIGRLGEIFVGLELAEIRQNRRHDQPVQPAASERSRSSGTARIAIWPLIVELPSTARPRQKQQAAGCRSVRRAKKLRPAWKSSSADGVHRVRDAGCVPGVVAVRRSCPASSSRHAMPPSLRRAASVAPADPPPMMIVSYSCSITSGHFHRPRSFEGGSHNTRGTRRRALRRHRPPSSMQPIISRSGTVITAWSTGRLVVRITPTRPVCRVRTAAPPGSAPPSRRSVAPN